MSIIFRASKSLLKSEMAILYLDERLTLEQKNSINSVDKIKLSCNISPTLHHSFFRNLPFLFNERLLAKYIQRK